MVLPFLMFRAFGVSTAATPIRPYEWAMTTYTPLPMWWNLSKNCQRIYRLVCKWDSRSLRRSRYCYYLSGWFMNRFLHASIVEINIIGFWSLLGLRVVVVLTSCLTSYRQVTLRWVFLPLLSSSFSFLFTDYVRRWTYSELLYSPYFLRSVLSDVCHVKVKILQVLVRPV